MEAKPDEGTEDSKPHLGGSQENRQRPQKVEDDICITRSEED
jgi:hypothetical protein